MKNCREMSVLLHDYVEGLLEPGVSKQLDDHLADCPGCISSIRTYRRTIELSQELRCEEIPLPLQHKLRSFLKQQPCKPSLWSRLRARLTGARPSTTLGIRPEQDRKSG